MTTHSRPRQTILEAADRATGGAVDRFLVSLRRDDVSFQEMAFRLREAYGVSVKSSAVRAYFTKMHPEMP